MTPSLTKEETTALLLDGTRGIMGTRTSMLNPVNILACQNSLNSPTAEEVALLRPLVKGMSIARWKKLLGEQRWKEVRVGGAWLMPRSRIEELVEALTDLQNRMQELAGHLATFLRQDKIADALSCVANTTKRLGLKP